jgi:hypothetical protein
VSAVAIVLLLLGTAAAAFVVYAIYRYGVIPAFRNLRKDTVITGVWHDGGWRYRVSLIAVLIGAAFGGIATGAMLVTGLVWQAGVTFLVAMAIVFFANYHRFKILQCHRGW